MKPGAFEAIGMSVQQNVETAGLIFQTLKGLITRETSPKQMIGPGRHRTTLWRVRSRSAGSRCSA